MISNNLSEFGPERRISLNFNLHFKLNCSEQLQQLKQIGTNYEEKQLKFN